MPRCPAQLGISGLTGSFKSLQSTDNVPGVLCWSFSCLYFFISLMTACLPCLLFMEKEEFPVARDVTFHTSACFTLAKVQRCMVELRFSEWRRCIEQILLLSWLLSPAALAPLLQCRHCRFGKALDCALIWRKEPASGKSLCSSLILKFLTLKSNIPGLF